MKRRHPIIPLLGISFLLFACSVSPLQPGSSEIIPSLPGSSETSLSSESQSTDLSSEAKEESSAQGQSSSQTFSSSQPASSSSYPVEPPEIETDPRWNVDFSKRGKEFMDALGDLIRASGGTASSGSAIGIGAKAAAYPNENSSTFIPFYHAPAQSEVARQSDCNREHTWPDSRGGNMFENDPVMLRPTLNSDNNARGNFFYGLGGASVREWDPASLGYEDSRGECARVILYCVTAYHDYGISLSNNPGDATSVNSMGTLKTLLAWNRDYAPTDWEKTVNDRYDKLGYRRNPFVDHPGYADYIYDENGLRTSSSTKWHDRIDAVTALDGKKAAIVSQDPKSSGYFMMGDKPKGASIPWYITYTSVRYEGGKMTSDSPLTYLWFDKQDDGKYTIKNDDGEFLFGYNNLGANGSTYYSVSFASSEAGLVDMVLDVAKRAKTPYETSVTNASSHWDIGIASDGFATITTGKVYLECYNGSFCGYQYEPRVKPMLFA